MSELEKVVNVESEEKKENKCRNWTFCLYPDSAVDGWRDILDEMHLEWVESPLHDSDLNKDGTPKKPHWHIVLMFNGNKSYNQIEEISVKKLNGTIPFRVQNIRSMIRYLAHLDNPDKAQYSIDSVIPHGGADIANILKVRGSEKYKILMEIFDFCRSNEISEYTDLIDYSIMHNEEWIPIITEKHCFAITKYLDSLRHQRYTKKY